MTDTSTCLNTTVLPDASQPLIYFFILTTFYVLIRYNTSKVNINNSILLQPEGTNFSWTIIYVLLLVLGNYFINLNLTTSICGETQWTNTLILTLIPWVLIFGIIVLLLIMLPGWLSPFSNTIGYGISKFLGLDTLMDKILKPKSLTATKDPSPQEEKISDNLELIYSDRSLLINEVSEDNFNNFWNNMQKGKLIKIDPENKTKNKNRLYNFVIFKNIIAEYIWYLLCGGLVTSISYNYIVNSTCTRSVAQMSATHQAYTQLQNKLDNKKASKVSYTLS